MEVLGDMSIKKAAAINAASRYSAVFMNIIFTAILSRILLPDDYGIVAAVMVFTTFFERLSDLGFGAAVIQQKDLSKKDIDSIFTFTIFLGFVLGLLFMLLGYPIARIYKSDVYVMICIILSLSVFFNTINMVPKAVLMKEKRFALIGIRVIIVDVAGYGLAIFLALLGFKYYALIWQSIASAFMKFMWNKQTSKVKITARINFAAIRGVAAFSLFQFASNLMNYFEQNLDNLLIGIVLGSKPLAFYDMAYKITKYPVNFTGGIIAPVLHPILSEYQHAKEIIYVKYMKIQELISKVAAFCIPFCFSAGYEIIALLYGDQWLQAVKPFQYLSTAIYPILFVSTSKAIFQSLGDTKTLFKAGCINAVFTGALIILGVRTGSIETIALLVAVANWGNMFTTITMLMTKGFHKSPIGFLTHFSKDLLAIVIMVAILELVTPYVPITNVLLSFGFKLCLTMALYGAYLWVTKGYEPFVSLLSGLLKKKGKAPAVEKIHKVDD